MNNLRTYCINNDLRPSVFAVILKVHSYRVEYKQLVEYRLYQTILTCMKFYNKTHAETEYIW